MLNGAFRQKKNAGKIGERGEVGRVQRVPNREFAEQQVVELRFKSLY